MRTCIHAWRGGSAWIDLMHGCTVSHKHHVGSRIMGLHLAYGSHARFHMPPGSAKGEGGTLGAWRTQGKEGLSCVGHGVWWTVQVLTIIEI